jgi:hypothetical protein
MNKYKIFYNGKQYIMKSDTYLHAKRELALQLNIVWDPSKNDTQRIIMSPIQQFIDEQWDYVKE